MSDTQPTTGRRQKKSKKIEKKVPLKVVFSKELLYYSKELFRILRNNDIRCRALRRL